LWSKDYSARFPYQNYPSYHALSLLFPASGKNLLLFVAAGLLLTQPVYLCPHSAVLPYSSVFSILARNRYLYTSIFPSSSLQMLFLHAWPRATRR
jgi:hypothetical protein